MKLAQRIFLLSTLLLLLFDGKLPVNVHLHFHVSAKGPGPGKSSVEDCKSPPPAPSSAPVSSSKYASYFVSTLETPEHPNPKSFHQMLLSSKTKGSNPCAFQLKNVALKKPKSKSGSLCFRKEVLPRKKMVIFRAEKGLLKQVIHRSSLSLCSSESGSSGDKKCRPMTAAADSRHQYRV